MPGRCAEGATLAEISTLLSTMRAVSTGMVRLLDDLEDPGLQDLYHDQIQGDMLVP